MKKKSVIKLPFPELLYPYSPVAKPMPPPSISSVCDEPLTTVTFSCSLIPYLLGILEVYRYKDSFTGTDTEKTIAVGVMRQLMEVLAMSGCGCDDKVIIRRINPETGEVEISEDDGATWTTDPASIYTQATRAVPLSGENGDVKKCEAANNVIEHMKDLQLEYAGMIGEINTITDMVIAVVVAGVALLFAGVVAAALITLITPILSKAFEIARMLIGTTTAAYNAMFTEEAWTVTRCILYCNVSEDGSFSQGAWSAVQAELKSELGSGTTQAGANLASMVDVWGKVGLDNAARIGSGTEGNCDDCACANTCAEKYQIYQLDAAHGEILEYGDNFIIAACGAGGYLTLEAINYNDCCYVNSIEVLTGTGFATAFETCGIEPSPPWTPTTPIEECCSIMEFQFTVNGTIKIFIDNCP